MNLLTPQQRARVSSLRQLIKTLQKNSEDLNGSRSKEFNRQIAEYEGEITVITGSELRDDTTISSIV